MYKVFFFLCLLIGVQIIVLAAGPPSISNASVSGNVSGVTYRNKPASGIAAGKQQFGFLEGFSGDLYVRHIIGVGALPQSFVYAPGSDEPPGVGFGWAFGLRATGERAAIEVGLSILNLRHDLGPYTMTFTNFGIHAAYLYQPFTKFLPKVTDIYIGPTVNNILDEGVGVGGIIAVEWKVSNVVRLGTRYELTNLTNQFQTGLAITFEKPLPKGWRNMQPGSM